jgi:hypothetical protein
MLKKALIALIVLAAVGFLLTYPSVYVVRDGPGGTLYWNPDEALLFVEVGSSGARLSYLRYALEPFLVAMGHVRSPDNTRCSQVVVIRITDKDVQRYETGLQQNAEDAYCFQDYVLREGHIYVGYPAQKRVWKWSGNQFEPATSEELGGFGPMKSAHGAQFDNVDGWSMREYALGHVTYPVTLNGHSVTIVSSGETWPLGDVSVDLVRPGTAPQRIWTLDERSRIVSRTEYERIFGKQ